MRFEDGWFGMGVEGVAGGALGWMGISRETTNISFIFVPVYVWLQLDCEAKCELRVMQLSNFYQSNTIL